MSVIVTLLVLALASSLTMAAAWTIARHPGKSGWTDTIWSYLVGVAGVIAALSATGSPFARRILVAGLVGCWSFRLGSHILLRTLKGKDDPRYSELRSQWGKAWPLRLFIFLQIQGAAATLLMVAVLAAASNPSPVFLWSDIAGAAVLALAVLGEGIADRQLRDFAATPGNKNKINEKGLWSWSRHPNYFFEWLGWWAYPVIAIGPAGHPSWGWAALIGPVLIYWLLVHASGIPPTEAHMLRSRGEEFRSYQMRVNAFFPGPPSGRK